MLVQLSVENFRSFADEQSFSLVASNRLAGSHDDHAVSVPASSERVLKTAVVYGANGAGKSNLFKALRYLKQLALRARGKNSGTGREPFRLREGDSPTLLDISFVIEDRLFRYGVRVDDQRILEEWLLDVRGAKEISLFERITDSSGAVKIEADGLKGQSKKLEALATVGGPQNQTFLATINTTLEKSDWGADVAEVIRWFDDVLMLVSPTQALGPLGHMLSSDDDFLSFAGDFLRSASTGVDQLKVAKTELSESDLKKLVPASIVSRFLDDIAKHEAEGIIELPNGTEVLVERSDRNQFFQISVESMHKKGEGTPVSFPLLEESDGTKRLLQLIPALHHIKSNAAVYFIDEIDRSMHPLLVWNFVQFFLRSCEAGQRQIIITTHESNLLDLELLRRDEIWFAEKDGGGATHLYSLADFKVRKDLEIRKHYLQGRFGAVPYLGDLHRLFPDEGSRRVRA